jgi:hypothetical protein
MYHSALARRLADGVSVETYIFCRGCISRDLHLVVFVHVKGPREGGLLPAGPGRQCGHQVRRVPCTGR